MNKKFFPNSIQDYVELLKDDKYYDVTIEVGENPNVKIFRAHANILYYRFPYLRQVLVSSRKISNSYLSNIKLPDISPEVFKTILKYIYCGILILDETNASNIFDTLTAAEDYLLQELADYLQEYLIENKSEWLERNFELIYQRCFQSDNLFELQQFCINTMAKFPKKLFRSLDFASLPEDVLIQLIKRDDLQLKEIKIWEHVLNWGLAHNTTTLSSDPNTWTDDDFKTMKITLQNCLPLIRFFSLSSKEFTRKVHPYKKLLNHQFYDDLSNSYKNSDSRPNEHISIPRNIKINGIIDSKIVNLNIASIISRRIDKVDHNSNFAYLRELYLPYKFELLLRGSQVGFTPNAFHILCDDKPNTVVFIKIKGTEEILGGYNPLEWKSFDSWGESKDSFIFSFKSKNNFRDAIISNVIDKSRALRFHHKAGPYFGQDLVIHSSDEFAIFDKIYCKQMNYDKKINGIEGRFSMEDYEVFQLLPYDVRGEACKNEEDAFEAFKGLSEEGNLDAKINLAYCYNRGIGTKVNNVKAFELYKQLVEKGYLSRRNSLTHYRDQTTNVLTFELCKKLAQKENVTAQYNLGILYFEGEGIKKNLTKAAYWYQKASENGNKFAQYNLGICYELGVGVSKDEVKAFDLYEKSSKNGYINAKFHLGYCYINGIGTDVDKEKGFELYNAAGKNCGDTNEKNEKSDDLYKVSYWYRKASKEGEIDCKIALYKLGEFYELGRGVHKSKFKAFDYYKQSAEKDYTAGKYRLGYYYERGIVAYTNTKIAFELYKAAAEEGNGDAQYRLASLYERGEGTEKNLEAAIYWNKEAIKNGCLKAEESLNKTLLNNGYQYI